MRPLWIGVVAVWLALVCAGLGMVVAYDNRPGVSAIAPASWPANSRLDRTTVPTLVMVIHPRCDCSRASLGELAEVMARAVVKPRAYVAILKPEGLAEDWDVTGLRRIAMGIPGVKVVRDEGGIESGAFGARTSGQTYLYGPDGRLLFSGGITSARGHAGESIGRTAILAHLAQAHQSTSALTHQSTSAPEHQSTSPVFGCSLTSPADQRWSQEDR